MTAGTKDDGVLGGKTLSRLVLGLCLGLATFVGFGLWADFRKIGDAIRSFDAWYLLPVLALSLANYLSRAWRWHYYLKAAGIPVPAGLSTEVFFSGLALSITPGKLGEVIKVGLLARTVNAPAARVFPVVVTERLLDLVAVLALTAVGIGRFGQGMGVLIAGLVVTVGFFAVLATKPGTRLVFKVVGLVLRRKVGAEAADESHSVQRALLSGRPLAIGLAIALAAWLAEALGLWLVVMGFEGSSLDPVLGTFVYASGTLAGAVSFLPGGLVATEATLTGMLSPAVFGALPTEAAAVAATLVIRIATLWFAVGLGVVGLLRVRRRIERM